MRGYLAAIATSANDAIIGKNLDGIILTWNDAASRLFGYSAAEMIGQSITKLIPPERLHEEADILEKMRRGRLFAHFDTERLTKDGQLVPVSLTISPIHDDDGAIIGVSKVVRDLSESQRITIELRSREALLESILETVPDALVVANDRGVILSFSSAAQRMFGYSAAEMVGQTINHLMPPHDANAHDTYMKNYEVTGQRKIIGIGRVVLGQRKNGTQFPLELQIGEVRIAGSHLFTGFMHDLTEHQDRDRRLQELQAELIHMSRLSELGQMVSALSHEVNQPLTAIANYAAGLRRMVTDEKTPALRNAVEKVAEQADRARRIVLSLRALVRKESRQRQIEALEPLIRETSALALLGTAGRVNLHMQVRPDAGAAFIDRVQIQQVLLNLMRNAVEAMSESPVRRLSVDTSDAGELIAIRVSDSGPGLSAALREKLFQPFVTTKAEGLGVGLSICRTIVEAHGGELVCEADDANGTTFSFTIPRFNGNLPVSDQSASGST
jgi:two-component system sensor kinase FixL